VSSPYEFGLAASKKIWRKVFGQGNISQGNERQGIDLAKIKFSALV
jgi:hypothetical protein